MRKLVADRFSQGCDVRDPDGLRELVVKLRQDLFGDLRWPNAERPCLSGEVTLTRVVREREVHLLLVADLHADERLTKAGDAEILPRLDVRVARERRQGLAWHGRVDVDGENVSGPRLAVYRPELRVGVAHRGDRALDVFVGGRSGLARETVRRDLDLERDLRSGLPTKRVLDGWRHGLRGVLHGERQW